MLKLIIEAGATKSDWALIDSAGLIKQWNTLGINPTSNLKSLQNINNEDLTAYNVSEIHYYGAGVNSHISINLITERLSSISNNAPKINVESDLIGAARSVWQDGKFIIGILGTGSNTGLFEGNHFLERVPSPGYLFGDDGSGFDIGQSILREYFMETMDPMSRLQFEMTYGNDMLGLRTKIYQSEKPNFEIARYARFLNEGSSEFKAKVLQKCFGAFVKNKLSKISDSKNYNVNFVGSIAKVFETELRQVLSDSAYTVDKIIDSPLEGIIKFHQKYGE